MPSKIQACSHRRWYLGPGVVVVTSEGYPPTRRPGRSAERHAQGYVLISSIVTGPTWGDTEPGTPPVTLVVLLRSCLGRGSRTEKLGR